MIRLQATRRLGPMLSSTNTSLVKSLECVEVTSTTSSRLKDRRRRKRVRHRKVAIQAAPAKVN